MSRRQPGRRGRGRRADEPELDHTAWLAELDENAGDADEEDWARTLRDRRPRGEQPAAPEPPAPDDSLLGMEPAQPAPTDWDVGWDTRDPMATAAADAPPDATAWPEWGLEAEAPLAWRAGQEAGAARPDDPWDAGAGAAGTAAAPDQTGWPFEETGHGWEPSDRSWIWPAEEMPLTTGSWEPDFSALDQPSTPPAAAAEPAPWDLPTPSWEPAADVPPVTWTADPAPDAWAPHPAADAWTPEADWPPPTSQLPPAPDPLAADLEPAVPLGPADGSDWDRYRPAGEDRWDAGHTAGQSRADGGRRGRRPDPGRRSWPRIVAILSWIVLLMVLCWYYVFPWLERVLPANF